MIITGSMLLSTKQWHDYHRLHAPVNQTMTWLSQAPCSCQPNNNMIITGSMLLSTKQCHNHHTLHAPCQPNNDMIITGSLLLSSVNQTMAWLSCRHDGTITNVYPVLIFNKSDKCTAIFSVLFLCLAFSMLYRFKLSELFNQFHGFSVIVNSIIFIWRWYIVEQNKLVHNLDAEKQSMSNLAGYRAARSI